MKRLPLLSLWIVGGLALPACFNPDFGPGGFACKEGKCPEGYVCSPANTCVKEGTPFADGTVPQPDGRTADSAVPDGPTPDLGIIDGPAVDAATLDAALHDAAIAPDTTLPDTTLPDTATPADTTPPADANTPADTTTPPDTAVPADAAMPPDTAMAPDMATPDTAPSPDTAPWPDSTPWPDLTPPPDTAMPPDAALPPDQGLPPVVCKETKVSTALGVSQQPFDLALGDKAKPNVVFVDNNVNVVYAMPSTSVPGTWVTGKIAPGDRVAIDVERPPMSLVDTLHVIYRDTVKTPQKLYHTYRAGTKTWSTPVMVTSSPDLFYMDIGADAADIFVVAGGYTTFSGGTYKPILYRWQFKPATPSGYTYTPLGTTQSNEFQHVRVDTAKAGWGYAVWADNGFGQFWTVLPNNDFSNSSSIPNANVKTSPAAVAVDDTGHFHFAFVRDGATSDTLVYGFWDGLKTSPIQETTVYTGTVHPGSVDIAVDKGLPYITYSRGSTNPAVYFSWMDSGSVWHHTLVLKTLNVSPQSRVALDPSGSQLELHALYADKATLFHSLCTLP